MWISTWYILYTYRQGTVAWRSQKVYAAGSRNMSQNKVLLHKLNISRHLRAYPAQCSFWRQLSTWYYVLKIFKCFFKTFKRVVVVMPPLCRVVSFPISIYKIREVSMIFPKGLENSFDFGTNLLPESRRNHVYVVKTSLWIIRNLQIFEKCKQAAEILWLFSWNLKIWTCL